MNKVTTNTFWILSERIIFVLAGIFVNIYVARYLGPSSFGLLGFAIAITGLISPLATFGANNIIFNRIAKNKQSGLFLLAVSSKARKLAFLTLATILTLFAFLYFETTEEIEVFCLILWGSFFLTNDVYQVFFNSALQAKKNAIAQNIGLAASVILKLLFIKLHASVAAFAVASIIQWAVSYFIKWRMFAKETREIDNYRPRNGGKHLMHLFRVGLPLAFSGLSIVLYTKTDQIMLGAMIGHEQVGYYSSAITLAQGWLFLPVALITSYMVRINESHKESKALFEEKSAKLFSLVFFITLAPALILATFSSFFIDLLYGAGFSPASPVLQIAAITSIFSAMGTVSYRIITVTGGYSFLLKKMTCVSILNIALNFYLIPMAGSSGAALATLISEILSSLLLNAFYKKGSIFLIQIKSMSPTKLKEQFHA